MGVEEAPLEVFIQNYALYSLIQSILIEPTMFQTLV